MNTNPLTKTQKLYPWLIVLFSALFLFYKYILQVSPSVMTNQLMHNFNITGAELGNLAATFFYTYLITQLFVGPLLDRYSPRVMTAFSILVCAAGVILFAHSQTLFEAGLARAIIGAGAAFATVSYMKLAAIWFEPRKFAFVGGLLATASMVGSLCGQAPLAVLIHYSGWRSSLLYIGIFGIIFAAAYFLVVRDSNPNARILETSTDDRLTWKNIAEILKKPYNWYLMFYGGLAFSPVAVFGGLWGNPFLKEAFQLTTTQASLVTSMLFIGLAVGAPILGFISDQVGKRYPVMFFSMLIALISLTFTIYVNHVPVWLVGLSLFSFGFGTGAFMLSFAVGKELNALFLAATVVGMINSGDALIGSFTEPLIGKILDMSWDGKMVDGIRYFSVSDFHIALIILPIYLVFALLFLKLLKKHI